MRRPLFILLMLAILAGTLSGDEPCKPCGEATSPVTVLANNSNNSSSTCTCPLFPIGISIWYGEQHLAGTACLSPVSVLLIGDYATGVCVSSTCTGNGCITSSSSSQQQQQQQQKISPSLEKPVAPDFFPKVCKKEPPKFPQEHALSCLFTDPRFVTFRLKNRRRVTAKLFAVVVDVKKRTKSGKENPQRRQQIAFLGYECTNPPVAATRIRIKSEDARHVVVDLMAHQGIVLLAKQKQAE